MENKDKPIGIRLNKYVAHCGIASRRQAAELVKAGKIVVNGEVENAPAYLVQAEDEVKYQGKVIVPIKEKHYLLLNKPKDFITTKQDEKNRKTVLDLCPPELRKIIYPVGRLDRMTTGLLLLTNDGDLALRLTHPRHKIAKVYETVLDKELDENALRHIRDGLILDDGAVKVDAVNYIHGRSKNEIAIQLHVGRNRIVRRIFEHMGCKVLKLDRTRLGPLSKKNLPRGKIQKSHE